MGNTVRHTQIAISSRRQIRPSSIIALDPVLLILLALRGLLRLFTELLQLLPMTHIDTTHIQITQIKITHIKLTPTRNQLLALMTPFLRQHVHTPA